MGKRLLSQAVAVLLGSLFSFASPAIGTYVGAEAAGVIGGIVGWVASGLFVLTVVFPTLGGYVDNLEATAQES